MNLSGNKGRVLGLTREINLRWSETKMHWRDARADEFERRFLAELTASVDRAMVIVDKLDEVLKKMRSECE